MVARSGLVTVLEDLDLLIFHWCENFQAKESFELAESMGNRGPVK